MNATTTYSCEYGYQLVGASSTYPVVATSTCTSLASTTAVAYGDWLFVNAIIIFCVAFVPISVLFGIIRTRR